MSCVTLPRKMMAIYTLQYVTLFPHKHFSLCPQDRLQRRIQKQEEENSELCPVETLATYWCPMQMVSGWELLMKYQVSHIIVSPFWKDHSVLRKSLEGVKNYFSFVFGKILTRIQFWCFSNRNLFVYMQLFSCQSPPAPSAAGFHISINLL